MSDGDSDKTSAFADRDEWADRFDQQAWACAELGSPLYGRLLGLIAGEIRAAASSWDVVASRRDLRFGQAGPLRLLGAAHKLALSGEAPQWAELLPSCDGVVPEDDGVLLVAWRSLVDSHRAQLVEGMHCGVQTNEVGRAAGLAYALAQCGFSECTLVELGCSGALNLRLDLFEVDLGSVVLGHLGSPVRLRPEIRGERDPIRHGALTLPRVDERIGIDPDPIDITTEDGRITLLSFVWPDQMERVDRVRAAIEVAGDVGAELLVADGSAGRDVSQVLNGVLDRVGPAVIQHSIVWQYVPTAVRWKLTEVIEEAGREATTDSPLAWIRYEPDEWDRRRAAIWLRSWPGGADRLVAHVDYHGRWLEPIG